MHRRIVRTLLVILVAVPFMSRIADAQGGDVRFSDSGRELLEAARAEARRLRHEYVGTEHILLALTSQTGGIALAALRRQGIDLAQLRGTIDSITRPGHVEPMADASAAYTTRTKRVFALAQESATALGQTEVGAEHLLIGILREAKGVGGQVLLHHGASLDALLETIRELRGNPPVP